MTGLLAEPGGPAVPEWFLTGTAPQERASSMWVGEGGQRRLMLPEEYAGWCASGFNRLGAVARPPAPGLAIESPRDGARFRVADALPASQQRIPLRLRGADGQGVTWSVNGRRLTPEGMAGQPEVWWPIERGEWQIVAHTAAGEARSRIRVD